MVSFESDYNNGAHPAVLRRLLETNDEKLTGYGADPYCEQAREKIRAACRCPQAEVSFLVGGTQTNMVVISSLLRDWEGVISADTGHIAVHEAGAIERAGCKVLPLPHHSGKLDAEEVRAYIEGFYADGNHEHMVFPGMVYITHPTELGTLYTKAELTALSAVCRAHHIPLYLDGARLAYGLAGEGTDVTLPDIASLCDVFYIGGTKCGALCGEAVVFTKENCPPHFLNSIKKRGALLAKGRLLGVQFDALFTDDLYGEIGRHAMEMARRLVAILREKGCRIWQESPTNQQYILLEDTQLEPLRRQVAFSFWEKPDPTHTVIRLVTSWSTTEEDLAALEAAL